MAADARSAAGATAGEVPEAVPSDGGTAASRTIARNAGARTVGELVAKLGTLAVFVLLARELGTEAYGQFTFALSLATVLVLASAVGTEDLMAREVSRDRSRLPAMLDDVITLKLATSTTVVLVTFLVLAATGRSGQSLVVFALVGGGTLLDNLQRTWHSVFQAFERMHLVSVGLVLQRVITAVGTVIALVLGADVVGVSVAYLVGSASGVLAAEVLLRRGIGHPRRSPDVRRWGPLLKRGLPIGAITLLFTFVLRVDMTLLGVLDGETGVRDVGTYGVSFRLFEATMFLSWSLSAAILPWFSRQSDADGLGRGAELALKTSAALLLPIGVGFAVFAPTAIHVIYGSAYDPSIAPLRVLGIITVCYGLNQLTASMLVARDRPSLFIRGLVPVAIVNVVLNVVLIPRYGVMGAAWSGAASGVMLVVIGWFQLRSVMGPMRIVRTVAGPIAAGGAMVLVGLALPVPAGVAIPLSLLAYAAALLVVEGSAFRDDLGLASRLVRRDGAPAPA